MADAKARSAPPTPRAEIRPREVGAHGETWRDDYAWIRAENWREVLRDPSALPPEIRALLEAENAYAEEILGPTLPLQASSSCAKCARACGKTTANRRRRTAPSPIIRVFAMAVSTASIVVGPAPAARRRCCSTAMRAPRAMRFSISAGRVIRLTISSSPGARTARARKCTRSACATSPPKSTWTTASRTPARRSSGRATPRRSSIYCRTKTIARSG